MGAGQRLTCDRYFHNVHIRLVSPQVLVSLITSNILTISKKTREREKTTESLTQVHTHSCLGMLEEKVKQKAAGAEPTAGWENKSSQILTRGEKIKKKKTSWSLKEKKKAREKKKEARDQVGRQVDSPTLYSQHACTYIIFYSRERESIRLLVLFFFLYFWVDLRPESKNEKMCGVLSTGERNREIDSRKYIIFHCQKRHSHLLSLASHQPVELGPLWV